MYGVEGMLNTLGIKISEMLLYDEDEYVLWARGWKGESVDAFRVAMALGS